MPSFKPILPESNLGLLTHSLEQISDIVWSIDAQTYQTLYLNPAVEAITGYAFENYYQNLNLWLEIILPIERERFIFSLKESLNYACFETQYFIIKRSGEFGHLRNKWWVIRDEHGQPQTFMGIATDITGLTADSQEHLAQALKSEQIFSYQYIQASDGSNSLSYLSSQASIVLGNISSFLNLFSPVNEILFYASLEQSKKYLTPWQWQWEFKNLEGCPIELSTVAYPCKQINGDVIWSGLIFNPKPLEQNKVDVSSPDPLNQFQLPVMEIQSALQQLFYLSIDLLCIAGLDGYFKFLNPAWEETLGYSQAELLQRPYIEFVHPEDHLITGIKAQELSDGQQIIYFENRYRCKNGSYKWLAWSSVAVIEEGLVYAIARDVTELKTTQIAYLETEKALRKSQRQYQTLAELSPVAIVQTNAQGHFLYGNQRWQEISGLTSEQAQQEGWLQVLHPEDRERIFEAWSQATQAQIPFRSEFRFLRPDGTTVWVIGQAQIERGEKGELLGFVSTITDISDSKQMEQELRDREMGYRLITRATNEAIWDWNIVTNGVVWNEGVKTLFGYTDDEVEPTATWWYEHIHVEDRDRVVHGIHDVIDQGQELWTDEYRYLKADGSYALVLDRGIIAHDDNGQPIRMIGSMVDITERRRSETALRESEQRIRILFEQAAVGICESGMDAHFIRANQKMADILGFSCEELIQLTYQEITHPADQHQDAKRTQQLIAGAPPQTWEKRFIHKNGSLIWAKITVSLVREPSGEPRSFIGIVEDISERKRAELEQQKLVSLVQNSNDFIGLASVEGRPLFINAAGLKLVGLNTTEQFQGTHVLDFVMPQEYQRLEEQITPSVVQQGFWRGELLFRNFKTGEPIPVDYTAFPIHNPQTGEIICLATISRDISEQKRAEESLRYSEAKFRKLAERLEVSNRLTTQIRSSLDTETILATTVQEIRNLLQLDRCLFIWYLSEFTPPTWSIVHEARNDNLESFLGSYPVQITGTLNQRIVDGKIYRVNDVNTIADPIEREFFLSVGYQSLLMIPLKMLSGRIGLIVCISCAEQRRWSPSEVELLKAVANQVAIAINQAELYASSQESATLAMAKSKELEKALRQLKQTQSSLIQAEKMSSLGQMVAGIAHEINNPVSFIYGNLEHAREYAIGLLEIVKLYRLTYPNSTPEIADTIEAFDLDYLVEDLPKLLDSMEVGADRIREIVKSLRTFSRLDEAEMKAINLHESIDSTLLILQNRLKEGPNRPAIIVSKNYGDLPLINCLAGQLNQVFMNLLSNAIDAIEEEEKGKNYHQIKSSPGQIKIKTVLVKNQQVQIRISDNGIGMDAETANKIFDPFFTTKPIGKGTGLGLSISYQIIVEKHKGSLRCKSEKGKGTEFIIEIPVGQNQ